MRISDWSSDVCSSDLYMNRQYLDAALKGRYPAEMAEIFGEAWPDWPEQDLRDICQPLDFIGINYYTRTVVRDDPNHWPLLAPPVPPTATYTPPAPDVPPPALPDTPARFPGTLPHLTLYIPHTHQLGSSPPRTDRHACLVPRHVRQHPRLHHRKRRRLLRPAPARPRRHRRPAALRLSAHPHCGHRRRDRTGRRRARLYGLVAAR